MELTVIILTHNEEMHIERCIKSLIPISNKIHVIDSNSADSTVEIAKNLGAKVFTNSWINYAKQFQWALDNTNIKTKWVMRMDADEYITDELSSEILNLDELFLLKMTLLDSILIVGFISWENGLSHGGYYRKIITYMAIQIWMKIDDDR